MQETDLYIKIENYLSDQMTTAERLSFEEEIQNNELIRQEVELYQQINEMVLEQHLSTVSQSIHTYHKKEVFKAKMIKSVTLLSIALLIGGLLFFSWKKINTQENNQGAEKSVITSKNNTTLNAPSPNRVSEKISVKETNRVSTFTSTEVSKQETEHIQSIQPIVQPNELHNLQTTHTNNERAHENKKVTNPIAIDPCAQSNLQVEYKTYGTCFNSNEGEVKINKITGGEAPYITHLYDAQHKETSLLHLKTGYYSLQVLDQNNCTITYKDIHIVSKACTEEYVINPSIGENWQIPIHHSSGELQIMHQNGNLLYKKFLAANEQELWNGVAMNGKIEVGLHSFIIQYKDGNVIQGTITIVE
jgi:hypothetical protein